MSDLSITIGKGENKTIRFKLKTDLFENTDKLLFAIKNDVTSKNYIKTYEKNVNELDVEIVDNKNQYTFSIVLDTETTRSLELRTYYYDLTLIDQYGEEKPLVKPQRITITGTIGASLEKVGA